ncbi:MAG: alpha/beta fold hydrolase, partial [Gammaproteobacteria bacterium]
MKTSAHRRTPGNIALARGKSKAAIRRAVKRITFGWPGVWCGGVLLAITLTGCSTVPARALDEAAGARGLTVDTLPVTDPQSVPGARLRTFANSAFLAARSAAARRVAASRTAEEPVQPSSGRVSDVRLHVYLDGDGRPLIAPRRVARDPTPAQPLVLDLLAQDAAPALYLGRPCYHGLQSGCDARDWTLARYGPRVVSALVDGLRAAADQVDAREIVLIGYSGGGALAVLVADRLPEVSAVVTLAANLDTDAWAAHHGYSPLVGSNNPAALPTLPRVPQRHYTGAADRNVPPELQVAYRIRADGAVFVTFPDF